MADEISISDAENSDSPIQAYKEMTPPLNLTQFLPPLILDQRPDSLRFEIRELPLDIEYFLPPLRGESPQICSSNDDEKKLLSDLECQDKQNSHTAQSNAQNLTPLLGKRTRSSKRNRKTVKKSNDGAGLEINMRKTKASRKGEKVCSQDSSSCSTEHTKSEVATPTHKDSRRGSFSDDTFHQIEEVRRNKKIGRPFKGTPMD